MKPSHRMIEDRFFASLTVVLPPRQTSEPSPELAVTVLAPVIGERLVIAEAIEFSPDPSDWVYLHILYCEGDEAEEYRSMLKRRDMETRKKRRNLHDLKRLSWSDEDARMRIVNDPEHSKFIQETEERP